jgi:fatty-acyl-CoA synthase
MDSTIPSSEPALWSSATHSGSQGCTVSGHVTPGYYRAREFDAEAFDKDGYFLTGDLGSIEMDGRIRFRGRLKEMIKTGGINVAPLEVRASPVPAPDIVQAYVVGVPDPSKGEIVAAAVELRGVPAAWLRRPHCDSYAK